MATLLTLPREIRDIIYSYSLVVSEILLIPGDAHFDSSSSQVDSPATGLLTVSKAIRDETLPIILNSNTWRITYTILKASNKRQADLAPQDTNPHNRPIYTVLKRSSVAPFLESYGHMMRHVVLNINFRRELDFTPSWMEHTRPRRYLTKKESHARRVMGVLPSVDSINKALGLMQNLRTLALETRPYAMASPFTQMSKTQLAVLEILVERILVRPVPKRLEVRSIRSFTTPYELSMMTKWMQDGLGRGRLHFGSRAIEDLDFNSATFSV